MASLVLSLRTQASACAFFAASHPDRASALILYGASTVGTRTPDEPWAWSSDDWQRYLQELGEGWGKRDYIESILRWAAPSAYDDPHVREWFVSYQRLAVSPSAVVAIESIWRDIDLRAVLPSIAVPTLVLHRTGDGIESVDAGRSLSSRIPGARFVELSGDDHLPWAGDQDGLLDEVEDFLTGSRRGPDPIAPWRPCCSPTSSAPPREQRRSATRTGGTCSKITMPS